MTAVIFRHGDSDLKRGPVASATVIAIGDLLWYDTSDDTLKPASDFTWTTDLATTQAGFSAAFAGVARSASAAGETDNVTYDRSSRAVYEYDVASGTYNLDAILAPAKQTGDLLENQKLATAAASVAIARVADIELPATDRVRVTFAPAITTDSSNTNALIG